MVSAPPLFVLMEVAGGVPADDGWMTAAEAETCRGLKVDKRRSEWRLGRWTAKLALQTFMAQGMGAMELVPPHRIEVRAAADGAPEASVDGRRSGVALSISHSAGRAICGVAESSVALGCDIEQVEPRSDAFVRDYFTESEQQLIAAAAPPDQHRLATLLWSAKESALKALRVGLKRDTRTVEVSLGQMHAGEKWSRLSITDVTEGGSFCGWWRQLDDLVLTVATRPPLYAPEFQASPF